MGFIRNLPHTLVTSFRATLEEVEQAEVLLHVRDAASTYGDEQKAQVEKVLGELEALGKPRIEVLNKIDLLGAHEREGLAAREQPRTSSRSEVLVSAQTGEGMDALLAAIDGALHSDPVIEAELRVPQRRRGAGGHRGRDGGASRDYEGNLVRLVSAGRRRWWAGCASIVCAMIGRLAMLKTGKIHRSREGKLNPADSDHKQSITTLASREVYRNHWLRLREDRILRSNGKEGIYSVVEKDDCAIILPIENGRVWLVEQFRYTIQERALELPQGGWEMANRRSRRTGARRAERRDRPARSRDDLPGLPVDCLRLLPAEAACVSGDRAHHERTRTRRRGARPDDSNPVA